jgi:glycerol-3-phosphate dehydrogenase subunit B
MATNDDVLVVGGGLAGCIAALSAAREGAQVRLVSHAESTLRTASGLIDVLGYVNAAGPLVDPFAKLGALPPEHPYSVVGTDAIRAGLELFDDIVGRQYHGEHTDRNALIPTHGGTVKPTARYPVSVAPGVASSMTDTLLVGFETLPDFDAPLAAKHLNAAGVPFEISGVTISFPGSLRTEAKVARYATLLDTNEEVTVVSRPVPVRQALADAVKPHIDSAERVGLPAVLGYTNTEGIRADLASDLGTEVFEVPMGPPSLLGIRLETSLYNAMNQADIHVTTGNPIVGFNANGGQVEQVLMEQTDQEIPYAADQYILATGGLVGGGVDSERTQVYEPVFGCRVNYPENRYEWSAQDAFGDHAFARFGVMTDDALRPVDNQDSVLFENLRAAGGVLGGADFPAEKSGSGISLATGVVAGRQAGELV